MKPEYIILFYFAAGAATMWALLGVMVYHFSWPWVSKWRHRELRNSHESWKKIARLNRNELEEIHKGLRLPGERWQPGDKVRQVS